MKQFKTNALLRATLLLITLFSLSQCIVPYESARMLPRGATEIKGSFTHASEHFDGESAALNNGLGIGIGYGVSPRVNLKVRYERLLIPESDGEGINYFAFGPKFGLMPNKIALLVPVGLYFAEGESTWGIHPNLIFTVPGASNRFEASFGLRTDIFFEEDAELLIGLNTGLGFSQNLDRWAIRPDFGVIFNPGDRGVLLAFGVGASYNISSSRGGDE